MTLRFTKNILEEKSITRNVIKYYVYYVAFNVFVYMKRVDEKIIIKQNHQK